MITSEIYFIKNNTGQWTLGSFYGGPMSDNGFKLDELGWQKKYEDNVFRCFIPSKYEITIKKIHRRLISEYGLTDREESTWKLISIKNI